jgi:hypothetical protein
MALRDLPGNLNVRPFSRLKESRLLIGVDYYFTVAGAAPVDLENAAGKNDPELENHPVQTGAFRHRHVSSNGESAINESPGDRIASSFKHIKTNRP